MRRLIFLNVTMISIVLLSSCAVGRKMSFNNGNVNPDYSAAKPMAIAFQDMRKDVLDGKEKITWVGHMNSGAQIGYNILTESGKPAVDEFSEAVTNSLVKLGIKAEQVIVPLRTDTEGVKALFAKTDKERLLLFHVNQWEASETPRFSTIRYEVLYNFDVQVFDKEGKLLASNELHDVVRKEEAQLAASLKYLQRMADEVFTSKIRELLNDPKIKAVLQ